jgi:hypothetical protein
VRFSAGAIVVSVLPPWDTSSKSPITVHHTQWIGHNTLIGPKRLVGHEDARVFPTDIEAMWEIDAFRVLLPDGAQFEMQGESA